MAATLYPRISRRPGWAALDKTVYNNIYIYAAFLLSPLHMAFTPPRKHLHTPKPLCFTNRLPKIHIRLNNPFQNILMRVNADIREPYTDDSPGLYLYIYINSKCLFFLVLSSVNHLKSRAYTLHLHPICTSPIECEWAAYIRWPRRVSRYDDILYMLEGD